MVEQCRESRVVFGFADKVFDGQALESVGKVPVGEEVRQAKRAGVDLGKLGEEVVLGVVALDAKVKEDPNLLDAEVDPTEPRTGRQNGPVVDLVQPTHLPLGHPRHVLEVAERTGQEKGRRSHLKFLF